MVTTRSNKYSPRAALCTKLFAFLVLCAFAYNIAGYSVLVKMMQYSIQHEIKMEFRNHADERTLTQIELTPSTLASMHWEKANKEFILDGKMYDVVKTKTIKGKKILYCINDKKEQQLLGNFFQKNQQKKNRILLQKANTLLYHSQETSPFHFGSPTICLFESNHAFYQSLILEIPSPPPNNAASC